MTTTERDAMWKAQEKDWGPTPTEKTEAILGGVAEMPPEDAEVVPGPESQPEGPFREPTLEELASGEAARVETLPPAPVEPVAPIAVPEPRPTYRESKVERDRARSEKMLADLPWNPRPPKLRPQEARAAAEQPEREGLTDRADHFRRAADRMDEREEERWAERNPKNRIASWTRTLEMSQ